MYNTVVVGRDYWPSKIKFASQNKTSLARNYFDEHSPRKTPHLTAGVFYLTLGNHKHYHDGVWQRHLGSPHKIIVRSHALSNTWPPKTIKRSPAWSFLFSPPFMHMGDKYQKPRGSCKLVRQSSGNGSRGFQSQSAGFAVSGESVEHNKFIINKRGLCSPSDVQSHFSYKAAAIVCHRTRYGRRYLNL